ncbi:thiol reductant ABC exporter subunit CydD [Microbacterium sp. LRZ72]|uniref:thiol reductant ABC exporter subunit CydD n=1 Tax=Microbacterium sp. LRZ72 TaxID=2942481 RepID=UPI0029B43605|nr:thiol reductant ABC exporter subunit CydD [Microbacterium sp. LRZ72]MDX2376856.1 thiol reductant ABC exporter subunit CydD [Microbacterium sp. LRZ72]
MGDVTDAGGAPPARTPPVDPRLLRYARASRWLFVALAAFALLQTVVIVAFAWLLTRAITGAIEGMPASELAATLTALAGVVAVRATLLWGREQVAARASARVQSQLRDAVIGAVGRLGPGWLEGRSSAALAVTAGRGLEALDAYIGRYLPQLVQTAIATPIIVLVMWWADWISGLTVLLTLPLIPIFMILIGLATRAVQRRQWQTLQHLAVRFADTVQGLGTLKVFGRQHRAAASIDTVTERYRAETMKVLRVSFLSGFALEFLASISVAIIAVSIGFRLLEGSLTLTVGLFVLLLAPEAYLPLRQVGVQFHAAAEGVAATDDVFAVLDAAAGAAGAPTPPHGSPQNVASESPERQSLATGGGEQADGNGHAGARADAALRVRGMQVRRGERMLAPVDLTVRPGELVLLEGPSGAGKSSVLAALRGAAAFDGTAMLGRRDIRTLAPAHWLAWAGQQPGLVGGSVAANVSLGDDDPDDALVRRALDMARAGEISPAFELGAQGSGLSGGQAQRVAVARALYRHLRSDAAPVIALDEPSAALDRDTEAALWRSLRELADAGAAIILVSHRISARASADAVVRMQPEGVTV